MPPPEPSFVTLAHVKLRVIVPTTFARSEEDQAGYDVSFTSRMDENIALSIKEWAGARSIATVTAAIGASVRQQDPQAVLRDGTVNINDVTWATVTARKATGVTNYYCYSDESGAVCLAFSSTFQTRGLMERQSMDCLEMIRKLRPDGR